MDTITPPIEKKPEELVLTDEQKQAVDLIVNWMKSTKPEFKLGGYAGTGKTTIIKTIRKLLSEDHSISVNAFTGKAVAVLSRKGVSASTLHSMMYDCTKEDKKLVWLKKRELDADPDLVIVDESSMLSTELYRDLKSYGKKYLFVGDPGQLEPVGENPNLMAVPDFVLKKIHRQAEKSPILRLASSVRQGGSIPYGNEEGLIVKPKNLKADDFLSVNQVLCAKNKTRLDLNARFRRSKGLVGPMVKGEKLIVLRNNPQYGVFNGMILFVEEIKRDASQHWECKCKDEMDNVFYLDIWKPPFEKPLDKDAFIPKDFVYCDYTYAITCHKSQGSEWDKVLVIDEWMPPHIWDMKRWRYTAITRAAQHLTYCL